MENPSTKKKLFKNISSRDGFAATLDDDSPATYARNPGMIGRMHGERNDTMPAKKATKMGMLTIVVEHSLYRMEYAILLP